VSTGGNATGGSETGGVSTGGNATGGSETGGVSTGGNATGGSETGGVSTGGNATGGDATGGVSTGGNATGGSETGGVSTGGNATGGDATGGSGGGCPDGCQIGVDCVSSGDRNPDNACQACVPHQSSDDWSNLDGEPCDDDQWCNGEDLCSGGACVVHSGNPCSSSDTCRESDDICCTPTSTMCSNGDLYLQDSCGGSTLSQHCAGDCIGHSCRCVIYVDGDNGSDGEDGSSWGAAKATLQAAIDAAEGGGCEVWATGSIYQPAGSTRDRAIQLKSGVAVYGGFYGSETDREVERPTPNTDSTITGDNDAYHVVLGADDALLDGFTITGGYADGGDVNQNCGGGLLNYLVAPTIRNCVFYGNYGYRGGAVCNIYSTGAQIEQCSFYSNGDSSTSEGGAIYSYGSSPTIVGSSFVYNYADGNGGALTNDGWATPSVIDSVFRYNEAARGGAVADLGATSHYSACSFEGNLASDVGGALFANGGAAPVIGRCAFSGNQAGSGGALYFDGAGSPYVANSVFTANHAPAGYGGFGGAVLNYESSLTLVNCIFDRNEASDTAGTESSWGGAVVLMYSTGAMITNCTFYANVAVGLGGVGGAIYSLESTDTMTANSIFHDNAAQGGGADIFDASTAAPLVTRSIIGSSVSCVDSGTCLDEDPLFVSEWDYTPQNPDCIDSGDDSRLPDDTADVDGDYDTLETVPLDVLDATRVLGSAVDMGAIEVQ
ncbi:MAG: hypothetical protein JW940_23595, partial [Polyangiaceae bacterium]|nr:hypothetical protein [Polyangiaceae bacterium]